MAAGRRTATGSLHRGATTALVSEWSKFRPKGREPGAETSGARSGAILPSVLFLELLAAAASWIQYEQSAGNPPGTASTFRGETTRQLGRQPPRLVF